MDATTGVVTSTSYAGTSTGSLVLNYDVNAEPSSLVLTNVAGSFAFPVNNMTAQTSVEGYDILSGATGDGLASFSAIDYGDYLTFGIWTSSNAASTLAYGSGFYMGDVTSIASVPASGQATYNGRTIGFYASTAEGVYLTGARFAGVVDFSSRTLGVTSAGTTGTSVATGLSVSSPLLDWSGAGTLSGDGFSGTIAQGNGATGSFSGKFFGPSVEAMGGSFGTSNAGGIHYGSFGGVK